MADFTYIVSLKGSIKVLTYTGLQPRTGGGLTLPDANVDADESSDVEFFPGAAKVKKPAATDSVEGGIYSASVLQLRSAISFSTPLFPSPSHPFHTAYLKTGH